MNRSVSEVANDCTWIDLLVRGGSAAGHRTVLRPFRPFRRAAHKSLDLCPPIPLIFPAMRFAHFYSCDWGTTSFRLRLVRIIDRAIVGDLSEPTGVKTLLDSLPASEPNPAQARARLFAEHLRSKMSALAQNASISDDNFPVVISGMASSTVGWLEVPYANLPFATDGSQFRFERLELDGPTSRAVYLISGLATKTDIMRGEETELVGLIHRVPPDLREFIIVLPGTHSKHVTIRDGLVVDFHTYMTGELFELLATQSLLRVSVQWPLPSKAPNNWSDSEQAAFLQGVKSAQAHGLARSLFRVRTRTVLDHIPPAANSWFLSGLLIGTELADLAKTNPGRPIVLAANEKFGEVYRLAATSLAAESQLIVLNSAEIMFATVTAHLRFLERQVTATSPFSPR